MKYSLIIITALLLTSCATVFFVDESGKEYVRIEDLNLTPKQELKLHWMTERNDSICFWSSRYQNYYYDKDFDYNKLLSK